MKRLLFILFTLLFSANSIARDTSAASIENSKVPLYVPQPAIRLICCTDPVAGGQLPYGMLEDSELDDVQGEHAAVVAVYAVPGVGEAALVVTAAVGAAYVTYKAYEKAKEWYTSRYSHDNRVGPSGKYKRHRVRKDSRKSAREAAKRKSAGNRDPLHHPSPKKGGKPHYHPVDKNGNKRYPNVHYEYPKGK